MGVLSSKSIAITFGSFVNFFKKTFFFQERVCAADKQWWGPSSFQIDRSII